MKAALPPGYDQHPLHGHLMLSCCNLTGLPASAANLRYSFFGEQVPRLHPLEEPAQVPIHTKEHLFYRYLQDCAGLTLYVSHPLNHKALAYFYIGFAMLGLEMAGRANR
jgi:hypothetical protein